jgi:hypothetical protein
MAPIVAAASSVGRPPDAEHEALLDRYIEGTATLADLYAHAREYVYTAQERQQLEIDKERLGAEFSRMRVQYDAETESMLKSRNRRT